MRAAPPWPQYPREPTKFGGPGNSEMGQVRTNAPFARKIEGF